MRACFLLLLPFLCCVFLVLLIRAGFVCSRRRCGCCGCGCRVVVDRVVLAGADGAAGVVGVVLVFAPPPKKTQTHVFQRFLRV